MTEERKTTVDKYIVGDDLYFACRNDADLLSEICHNYVEFLDDAAIDDLKYNLGQNYGID